MNQNINLFNFILKQRNMPLPFQTMLNIFYTFLLLMACITIILTLMHLNDIYELKKLQEKQVLASKQLLNKSSELPPQQNREQLAESIKTQEALKSKNEKMLNEMKNIFQKESLGFSQQLVSLSKAVPSGLWLTHFDFSEGGKDFSLSGKTTESKLITQLVDGLSQEPPFAGKNLEVFEVNANNKDKTLEFSLRSGSPQTEPK